MSGTSRATACHLRCAHVLLLAGLIFSSAGAAISIRPQTAFAGSATTTTALNLRAKASTSSAIKLVMPAGSTVTTIRRLSNGFYRVLYQGVGGYAHGDYLSFDGGGGSSSGGGGSDIATGGETGNASTLSSLNLRAGPSTSDRVLLVMPSGATVSLTGESSNGFLRMTYQGTKGWGYGSYIGTAGSGSVDQSPSSGGGGYDNGDGVWSRDEVVAIIYSAAAYYGQSGDDMLRVAICESGLDPYNVTPPYSASGLFQFLPGTWATTPYASSDIFDPVSNAFATGWMWSVGRRGEWVCQ
jgi:uncharacterized protein YraI